MNITVYLFLIDLPLLSVIEFGEESFDHLDNLIISSLFEDI